MGVASFKKKTIDSFTSITAMSFISVHFFSFFHASIEIIHPGSDSLNESLYFFKNKYFFWEVENTALQQYKSRAGKWNKLVNPFEDMEFRCDAFWFLSFIMPPALSVSTLMTGQITLLTTGFKHKPRRKRRTFCLFDVLVRWRDTRDWGGTCT